MASAVRRLEQVCFGSFIAGFFAVALVRAWPTFFSTTAFLVQVSCGLGSMAAARVWRARVIAKANPYIKVQAPLAVFALSGFTWSHALAIAVNAGLDFSRPVERKVGIEVSGGAHRITVRLELLEGSGDAFVSIDEDLAEKVRSHRLVQVPLYRGVLGIPYTRQRAVEDRLERSVSFR